VGDIDMNPLVVKSSIVEVESKYTYAELLRRIGALEALLHGLDITMHGASRVATYRRTLEKLDRMSGGQLPSTELREELFDLLLESDELARSISIVTESPPVPGWRPKVERALGGQPSARCQTESTISRNTQFELLLAALMRRAGYQVQFGEPDLILHSKEGEALCIAAKRITSGAKFAARASEASKQIKRSGVEGLVAVSLGFFGREPRDAESMRDARQAVLAEAKEFALRRTDLLRSRMSGRGTLGLMVCASRLVRLHGESELAPIQGIYIANLAGLDGVQSSRLQDLVDSLVAACEGWLQ
jgi:hypothetical protein